MNIVARRFKDFLVSEDGPTATEYAVMLALIIVVAITAITTLGGNVNSTFEDVNNTAFAP
jgi:pilus assembly protein Flp/PilA